MERHRRGKGKQKLLGSHQKCWIWGRNLVLETLAAGRWKILDLHLSSELPESLRGAAFRLACERGLAPVVGDAESLTRICHTSEHQGFLARMTEFPYAPAAELLAALPAGPFCVVLDGIQDPHNFGAIVRSAEVFGADAVWIGERGQVGVTSMVARSSVGAVNRIPIARVPDLVALAGELKGRGVAVVGASEKAERPLMACDFRGGTAIVIGNEGVGPTPALKACCDAWVAIPQVGRIGSLNAAVAAGIFFYEVRRQRG
jgi:23S rRNA (guanosine2251-2'-O)-methyltransferase